MAMASKEEVLDLYTRIIRGEEVDSVTLQAAKALARHYGIDAPGKEPEQSGGDVIIVDDIDKAYCMNKFEEAYKEALNGPYSLQYVEGVESLYKIYKDMLQEAK